MFAKKVLTTFKSISLGVLLIAGESSIALGKIGGSEYRDFAKKVETVKYNGKDIGMNDLTYPVTRGLMNNGTSEYKDMAAGSLGLVPFLLAAGESVFLAVSAPVYGMRALYNKKVSASYLRMANILDYATYENPTYDNRIEFEKFYDSFKEGFWKSKSELQLWLCKAVEEDKLLNYPTAETLIEILQMKGK